MPTGAPYARRERFPAPAAGTSRVRGRSMIARIRSTVTGASG
ncbi:MAG: hypothetical protein ACRDNK_09805 [Solirubrobacteraceae bacterium]